MGQSRLRSRGTTGRTPKSPSLLKRINRHAAGIDCGSETHFVAVPTERDREPVRSFKTFTADLHRLADWLEACKIKTVAMESTGVYWIPIFEILEARGFEVVLVNSRHIKNVPGRKTDVLDCQWIQELHSVGLLRGSFRPAAEIATLRAYLRHREKLVQAAATHIHRMQKALAEMNLQLHNVISDITGLTGMRILRDIVAGVHDPATLAAHRDYRCRASEEKIAASLTGNYRAEHLFALRQNLELFDTLQRQIQDCDHEVESLLHSLARKQGNAGLTPDAEPGLRFASAVNEQLARGPVKDIYIYVHGYRVNFENPLLIAASWPTSATPSPLAFPRFTFAHSSSTSPRAPTSSGSTSSDTAQAPGWCPRRSIRWR